MRRIRDEAGYSLVELMIVVAIIGIMAAIAVPTFKGFFPRIRLNSNVMILTNEIALARVRAISRSNDFRITFDTGSERYTLAKFQAGAWQNIAATALSGSDLVGTSGFTTADTLIAMGNGQINIPLNTTASIEVRTPSGDRRKRILVEPTGRTSVQRWTGASWVQD